MNFLIEDTPDGKRYFVTMEMQDIEDGSTTEVIMEELGGIKSLERRFGKEDPVGKAREYAENLTEEEWNEREYYTIKFSTERELLDDDKQLTYNVGYLFLRYTYLILELDKVCAEIKEELHLNFDLNDILSNILYTRIIYPDSPESFVKKQEYFFEHNEHSEEEIVKALEVLGSEAQSDRIRLHIKDRLLKLFGYGKDDTYYYENAGFAFFLTWYDELGVKETASKTSDTYLIRRMGIYTGKDSIPIIYTITEGTLSKEDTLKELDNDLGFSPKGIIECNKTEPLAYDKRFGTRTRTELRKVSPDIDSCIGKMDMDTVVRSHFTVAFLSLIIKRFVEYRMKNVENELLPKKVTETLQEMNLLYINDDFFLGSYRRSRITDALHDGYGFYTDYNILKKETMEKIISDMENNR